MPDVNIRVTAEDDASGTLANVAGEVESVGESAKQGASGMADFAEAASGGAREVEHAMSMLNRMDLAQITVENSTNNLESAQQRYNDAVSKYGAHSQQAEQALRQLENAHNSLDKAQIRAEMSMALVGVQALNMAVKAIPTLETGLASLAAAEGVAATSAAILNITLTAGAAAISIMAGIAAVTSMMQGFGQATDSADGSVQALTRDTNSLAGAFDMLQASSKNLDEANQGLDDMKKKYENMMGFHPLTKEFWLGTDVTQGDIDHMQSMIGDMEKGNALATQHYAEVSTQAMETFVRNEDLKKQAAEGNEGAIANLLQQARDNMAAVAAAKPAAGSAPDAIAAWERAYESAEGEVKKWEDAQTQATDKVAKAHEEAAAKAKAAWEKSVSDMASSMKSFSDAALASIAKTGDLRASAAAHQEMGNRAKELAMYEEELAHATGPAREQILKQMAAVKDKTGAHTLLNEALDKHIITEGEVKTATEAATGAIDAQGKAVAASADSAQQALDAYNAYALGLQAVQYGNTPLKDDQWGRKSLLNTRPGVDVTGVARGVYAAYGRGFESTGTFGSTDLGNMWGSRIDLHNGGKDGGYGDPQGGGTVNMGGVNIQVVVHGGTAASVQQGIQGALSQVTSPRTGLRRNI